MRFRFWERPKFYGCRVTLEQLEDRIVLDAAGGASQQPDDHQNDAAHNGTLDAEHAGTQAASAAAPPPGSPTSPAQAASHAPQQTAVLGKIIPHNDLNVLPISNDPHEIKGVSDGAVSGDKVTMFDAQEGIFTTLTARLSQVLQSTGQKPDNLAADGHGNQGEPQLALEKAGFFNVAHTNSVLDQYTPVLKILGSDFLQRVHMQFHGSFAAEEISHHALAERIHDFTTTDGFHSLSTADGAWHHWRLESDSESSGKINPLAQADASIAHHPDSVSQGDQGELDVVLISSSLQDIQAITDAVERGAIVIVFDAQKDNLASVVSKLDDLVQSTGHKINDIALIGHGDEGVLRIGTDRIDTSNVESFRAAFEELGKDLAEGAQIQLYACSLAGNAAGQSLLQSIGTFTRADVFGSVDKTGGPEGDWVLEYSTVAGTVPVSMLSSNDLAIIQHELASGPPVLGVTDATATLDSGPVNLFTNITLTEPDGDPCTVYLTVDPAQIDQLTATGGTWDPVNHRLELSGTAAAIQADLNTLQATLHPNFSGTADIQIWASDHTDIANATGALHINVASHGDDVRVLFVSSSLTVADQLVKATQDGVLTIPYDSQHDSLETLLQSAQEALGGRKADSIAFATHDLGQSGFYLTG